MSESGSKNRVVRRRRPVPPEAEPAEAAAEAPKGTPKTPSPAGPIEPERGPEMDAEALLAEIESMSQADFAQLLKVGSPRRFEDGEEVEGTVVRVRGGTAFVDLGAKAEGILDLDQLSPDAPAPTVGAKVSAFVLRADETGIRLGTRLRGGAGLEALEHALEAELPVDGRVTGRNKGGFEIALGPTKAFCPVSQIDRIPNPDLDTYIGQSLAFRILEVRGKDVVVSHRAIAQAEADAQAETLWGSLKEGDRLDGVVVGVKDFGVFVDVGGIRGLVPKRELGFAAEAATPIQGDNVGVVVVRVDRDAQRLTLSLKGTVSHRQNGGGSSGARGKAQADSGSLGTMADLFGGLKLKG